MLAGSTLESASPCLCFLLEVGDEAEQGERSSRVAGTGAGRALTLYAEGR